MKLNEQWRREIPELEGPLTYHCTLTHYRSVNIGGCSLVWEFPSIIVHLIVFRQNAAWRFCFMSWPASVVVWRCCSLVILRQVKPSVDPNRIWLLFATVLSSNLYLKPSKSLGLEAVVLQRLMWTANVNVSHKRVHFGSCSRHDFFFNTGSFDFEKVYCFERVFQVLHFLWCKPLNILAPFHWKWGSSGPTVVCELHMWLISVFSKKLLKLAIHKFAQA